jgi:hypothetical protein
MTAERLLRMSAPLDEVQPWIQKADEAYRHAGEQPPKRNWWPK